MVFISDKYLHVGSKVYKPLKVFGFVVCLTCSLAVLDFLHDYTTGQMTGRVTTTSLASSIDNELLRSSLKREYGEGWKISRLEESVTSDNGYKCKWIEFKSTSGKTAQFCVHPFADGVSGQIEVFQRWRDCDVLPMMWEESKSKGSHTDKSIYVEIGANIGACVMEMLLSTDANIIAFEPHPRNRSNLQNTLSKLDKSLQDRVVVVPIALGSEKSSSVIYSAEGNMGNSVVGKIVKDFEDQVFLESEQHVIQIERLDSILISDVDVPLMKLDAQGFECNILKGMGPDLSQKIKNVHFEFAKAFLHAQNCMDLLPQFRQLGYEIYMEGKKFEGDTIDEGCIDMLAKRETVSL